MLTTRENVTYLEIQVDAQLITVLTEDLGFHPLSGNEMNLRIHYLVYQLISGNSKKAQDSCDITCILN
jgi:hypothetical protein